MVTVSSVYSFRSPKGLRPKFKFSPPVPVVIDIMYSFILPEIRATIQELDKQNPLLVYTSREAKFLVSPPCARGPTQHHTWVCYTNFAYTLTTRAYRPSKRCGQAYTTRRLSRISVRRRHRLLVRGTRLL